MVLVNRLLLLSGLLFSCLITDVSATKRKLSEIDSPSSSVYSSDEKSPEKKRKIDGTQDSEQEQNPGASSSSTPANSEPTADSVTQLCVICQEDMSQDQETLTFSDCTHEHHFKCLSGLIIRGDQRCPHCRTEISPADIQAIDEWHENHPEDEHENLPPVEDNSFEQATNNRQDDNRPARRNTFLTERDEILSFMHNAHGEYLSSNLDAPSNLKNALDEFVSGAASDGLAFDTSAICTIILGMGQDALNKSYLWPGYGFHTLTPLHYVIRNAYEGRTNPLSDRDKNIDAALESLVHSFLAAGADPSIPMVFFTDGSPFPDEHILSTLFFCRSNDLRVPSINIVKKIVSHLPQGTINTVKDKWGDSLLIFSLIGTSRGLTGSVDVQYLEELLKIFTQSGLDINVKDVAYDKNGRTLLHAAVIKKDLPSVNVILKFKPDLSVADDNGRTPLNYAEILGQTDIINTLKKYEAKKNSTCTIM